MNLQARAILRSHSFSNIWPIILALLIGSAAQAETTNTQTKGPQLTLECVTLNDQSDREKQMARLPTMEGSFTLQAEPRPATGADRTRSRSRLGIAYDLRSFQRAAETAEIARRGCSNSSLPVTRQDLMYRISTIRAGMKRTGQSSAQRVMQKETDILNSQLSNQKKLFGSGLISLRDFDSFNEMRMELLLKKSELDAALGPQNGKLPLSHQEAREISSFFQNYVVGNDAENKKETLIESTLRNELETLLLRSKRNSGDPWNFIVSAGYEALSASTEPPKIPGYFQAELKLNLGSFWGSTPLEELRENPLQKLRQDFLTQAIRNSLTEMQNEYKTWTQNLEMAQLRLAELQERKISEEAGASASETKQESSKWNRERTRIELESLAEELRAKLELIESNNTQGKQGSETFSTEISRLEEGREILRTESEGTILPNGIFFSSSGKVFRRPALSVNAHEPTQEEIKRPLNQALAAQNNPKDSLKYATESPSMRMRAWQSFPDEVTLRFKYLGTTRFERKLASGEDRTQLGVFLLGDDQCNLIYVMLRIGESSPKLTVQSKTNPGQKLHEECGNAGYETLVSIQEKEIKEIETLSSPGAAKNLSFALGAGMHTLTAKVIETKKIPDAKHKPNSQDIVGELIVTFDDQLVWRGLVPARFMFKRRGIVGVRSDNARFEFDAAGRPGN